LTTLGYSAGRKTTIDVTDLDLETGQHHGFIQFAQPQAAWADAWYTIVRSPSIRRDQTIVANTFPLAEAAHALRYLVEGRPFAGSVLNNLTSLMRGRREGGASDARGITMEDTKIYLLAELAVLPGFLEEVEAIFRRLLSHTPRTRLRALSIDRPPATTCTSKVSQLTVHP